MPHFTFGRGKGVLRIVELTFHLQVFICFDVTAICLFRNRKKEREQEGVRDEGRVRRKGESRKPHCAEFRNA
jgi:hypothetical protein